MSTKYRLIVKKMEDKEEAGYIAEVAKFEERNRFANRNMNGEFPPDRQEVSDALIVELTPSQFEAVKESVIREFN